MSTPEITIRDARPSDQPAIAAFTQNTFHWGDYVAEVWAVWLREPQTRLLVAEVNGVLAGGLHVVRLGQREAWMEGMRVHPDLRRLGIAARLDAAGREWARRAGCRMARLETASDNYAAQAALVRFGYRRCYLIREWEAPAAHGEAGLVRQAQPRDLKAIVELWEHAWIRRAARSLIPLANGWRWGEFIPARARALIARGWAWLTPAEGEPRGFALVKEDDGGPVILSVVGSKRQIGVLLNAQRAAAHRRGQEKVWLGLPDSRRGEALARASGFKPANGGMLIYAAPL
jgi:ribosomal protein S18 acetylase RimI-like enzyme